jgi:hypothetical protein
MGRFQLELIYIYFPPSFHLTVLEERTVENKGKSILTNYLIYKNNVLLKIIQRSMIVH